MKKELLIGLAIGAGAVALLSGASATSLLFPALILACPLMMMFMMRGGHGGESGHSEHDDQRADASSDDKIGTRR
jgi:lipopolysaccharide export LptBFGC system permease protein LptF